MPLLQYCCDFLTAVKVEHAVLLIQNGTASCSPEVLVQRPILHRFREMLRRNILVACKIRDTPGDFEDPIVASSEETQALRCSRSLRTLHLRPELFQTGASLGCVPELFKSLLAGGPKAELRGPGGLVNSRFSF